MTQNYNLTYFFLSGSLSLMYVPQFVGKCPLGLLEMSILSASSAAIHPQRVTQSLFVQQLPFRPK